MGRMKICNPSQLDEPTEQREPTKLFVWPSREVGRAKLNRPSWEFDRFRTCDHQIHILTLYQLSYKLHVICSRWIRTTTSKPEIWYATNYTMELSPVAPEGVEPSLTEPKPVVLPLYHRAVLRSGGRTRTYGVKRQRIYSPPSLPLEHSRLYGGASWN